MAHAHKTEHITTRRLGWSLGLTLGFVVLEAGSGWSAHSLALLSDAGHNLADAAALGLSWYAARAATRPANARMTFGYHRVGILAALINSATLVIIAGLIAWEAVGRIIAPVAVHPGSMIIVAAIGVALNATITVWLHGGRADLNIRSAYLHMAGDAVAAAGVVVAGIVVWQTRAPLADPAVSFLIAALIAWSSWDVLKQSVNLLLEGTPRGVDMRHIHETITRVPGVVGVHDLHVWGLSAGMTALSCHINVATQLRDDAENLLKDVTSALRAECAIDHCTIQVELGNGAAGEPWCETGKRHDA